MKSNLSKFTISRNTKENKDPNLAAKGDGWIGIYRGSVGHEPHTTGSTPWLVTVEIKVKIQRAGYSNDAAEDLLLDSEKLVMDVLTSTDNLTLNGTVDIIKGFSIEYEFDQEKNIYFHSAIISIIAEVRA